MPELIEVTRMTQKVKVMLLGKTVANISGNMKGTGLLAIMSALKSNEGGLVTNVECNGKLMWIEFLAGDVVWWGFFTFGLEGGWCSDPQNKNNRLCIECSDGTAVYLRDRINYGSYTFTSDPKVYQKKMKERGFNLNEVNLNGVLTFEKFSDIVAQLKKDVSVCDFLLTKQNIVSGIGNYLKCEILYHAHISPFRTIKNLTLEELSSLHNSIVTVCNEALKTNGRTYKYSDFYTKDQCTFEDHYAVYEKQVDPFNNTVTKEKTSDGRYTYWVKALQC
jgi:formamidopyrimidine-DNA glycosylase